MKIDGGVDGWDTDNHTVGNRTGANGHGKYDSDPTSGAGEEAATDGASTEDGDRGAKGRGTDDRTPGKGEIADDHKDYANRFGDGSAGVHDEDVRAHGHANEGKGNSRAGDGRYNFAYDDKTMEGAT